ncbi:MAG: Smr/MutS family protein [Helicobacteraceae bacterium]|nr:Smr/MutS family protein [Helicobacteraceae bacterium]
MDELIRQLDLTEHFDRLEGFFARSKPFAMEGDADLHYQFLLEFERLELPPMPKIQVLEGAIAKLAKYGSAALDEIYGFVRMARFFEGLKARRFEGRLGEWIGSIEIDRALKELTDAFDGDGNLKFEVSAELFRAKEAIEGKKKQIGAKLAHLISSANLAPYLVDRQAHFIRGEETLVLRGGFSAAIAGKVIDRTQTGFFYVLPHAIDEIKKKIEELESECKIIITKIENEFSAKLFSSVKFLRFLDRCYDRFDHYQARIAFAKINGFSIINSKKSRRITLDNFKHPAIGEAKALSVDFDKQILLITGVNAGGKTVLLKSILSAALMTKYLIPFHINAANSFIGRSKGIEAAIADPQNAKNDISTFAGRMRQFAALLGKRDHLIGIDEIELGTDSDEAASLFRVVLAKLCDRGSFMVVTTHHKRLAALMASDKRTQFAAAVYDEKRQMPTYSFIHGAIGKSYAFETAIRYGIARAIVNEAVEIHGKDKERLNDLIERSSELERSMREKIAELDINNEEQKRQINLLKHERLLFEERYRELSSKLERQYADAIDAAKAAAKFNTEADIHRALNRANDLKKAIEFPKAAAQNEQIALGDSVSFMGANGVITAINGDRALIESDSKKIHAPLSALRKAPAIKPMAKVAVTHERAASASVRLDLHGMYAQEALEKLDKFLSNALLAGFDEVIILHGVGSGKLAYAVKEALKSHPRVVDFSDAPAHMGGLGATIVRL